LNKLPVLHSSDVYIPTGLTTISSCLKVADIDATYEPSAPTLREQTQRFIPPFTAYIANLKGKAAPFGGFAMSAHFQLDWKPERPRLLTQKQAAMWLNISERTVRNLIRARKLPCRYIGRRCLLPTDAVEKFARKTAQ
jgi:excisionase family DNA binding protein